MCIWLLQFRVYAAVQFGEPFVKDLSTTLRAVIVTGIDEDCVWLNPQTIQGFLCFFVWGAQFNAQR